jgi:hypothetical protein
MGLAVERGDMLFSLVVGGGEAGPGLGPGLSSQCSCSLFLCFPQESQDHELCLDGE